MSFLGLSKAMCKDIFCFGSDSIAFRLSAAWCSFSFVGLKEQKELKEKRLYIYPAVVAVKWLQMAAIGIIELGYGV